MLLIIMMMIKKPSRSQSNQKYMCFYIYGILHDAPASPTTTLLTLQTVKKKNKKKCVRGMGVGFCVGVCLRICGCMKVITKKFKYFN